MGSSLFARHYSGSRGFFPFLRVLRCFSSPACLFLPYGFRQEYARITTRGFPHSDTPGSTDGQLLPGAFRSRPRPSSALGAKASTVCSYSLDQKEHVLDVAMEFSRCARARCLEKRTRTRSRRHALDGGLSKLNSVAQHGRPCWPAVQEDCDEVDVVPGEPAFRTTKRYRPSTGPAPAGVRAPASLERR